MSTLKESQQIIEPVGNAFTITPNDSNDIQKTRALSLTGATANVDVDMAGGQRITITLVTGVIHPIAITKLWTTGTTATGVIGYY